MACKRTFQLNKLVRDEIVGLYQSSGGTVDYERLDGDELYQGLLDKLDEEVAEIRSAADEEELVKEIADVRSVLDAIAELKEITQPQITARINARSQSAGGFSGGHYIKTVTLPADSQWAHYHGSEPDRFPEIS